MIGIQKMVIIGSWSQCIKTNTNKQANNKLPICTFFYFAHQKYTHQFPLDIYKYDHHLVSYQLLQLVHACMFDNNL